MGGRKKQTVGYRYFFGIHMGAGRGPMDELVEIKVGDRTAWAGSVTANETVQINKPDLFGGDDKEGGIVGPLDVMMGRPDQAVNPRLAAMLGGLVPAFRGVATLFFDGLMCSGSPYPKPWMMRWRRALQGWDGVPWYPERAVVQLTGPGGAEIKAMNPAHILYECYTNADWGRGLERSRLDDAQWRAAADQLHAEGFGLCMAWLRQDSLSSFMQGVLDHVGAAQFSDPSTGLVVLRLIRDDFVADDLPLFDADSGLLSIDDDDSAAQAGAVNEVVVRYRSPVDGKARQVRVKNPAAIHALGSVSSTTKDYLGLPTAELALRVAQRDLRAGAGFVKKFKLRLDRRGFEVLPGGVFRIRDVKRGIGTMVVRAGRVEHGPLDDGAITITAVQDVFGLPATAYVDVQVGGWVPPATAPVAVVHRRFVELPYRDLVATGAEVPVDGDGVVAVIALAPTSVAQGFDMLTKPALASTFSLAGAGSFCAGGTLADAIDPVATVVELTGVLGLDQVRVGSAALIGGELVRVDQVDVDTGQVTISRGCADTVPMAHEVGAAVFFYEDHGAVDSIEYLDGAVLHAKLLTRTGAGVLAEAVAPTDVLTVSGRAQRPYPPGDLRLAGLRYPATVTAVTIPVTWRHRDRLLQADQIVDALHGDIGPEPGTTYSWRLQSLPAETLVASGSGLQGTGLILAAQPSGQYRLEVWSVVGGRQSWQRAGWSFAWEQSGTFLSRTLALGGSWSAGVVIRVAAGATQLASYTTTAGDGGLAGSAASLAAAIDGFDGFTAVADGAVVTVTGALGVEFDLVASVERVGLASGILQAAALANPGTSYNSWLSVGNYANGVVEPLPAGVALTVSIERPFGTVLVAFTYSTGSSEPRAVAFSGLQGAYTAVGTVAGYTVSPASDALGSPILAIAGPVGADGVHVRTSATAPFWLPVSVSQSGSAAVPADLPQVVHVGLTAAVVAGDRYVLDLDGDVYEAVVAGGESSADLASALAALVNGGASYSATSSGSSLQVSGATVGVAWPFSSRIVPALTVTPG